MVACVLDQGWTIEANAERFQVDAKTVRQWRDRYLAEGDAGLSIGRVDRSRHRTRHRRSVCDASSSCANSADGVRLTSVTKSAVRARPSTHFDL
jgi:transposase-like protein